MVRRRLVRLYHRVSEHLSDHVSRTTVDGARWEHAGAACDFYLDILAWLHHATYRICHDGPELQSGPGSEPEPSSLVWPVGSRRRSPASEPLRTRRQLLISQRNN